jgi:glutamyl-Q tRNA(Asp) synthetase
MYIGRFAPSPTGPLHFGSLLAATASYLEARSHQGKWLLRIEDPDKPREVSGAADSIIKTLAHYGFVWDAEITYQSRRTAAYQQALEQLAEHGHTYQCTCSRRTIRSRAASGDLGLIYPGTCRNNTHTPHNILPGRAQLQQQYAIRIRVPDQNICFSDAVQGTYCQNLATESGDFVIRRADRLFAYQLAVVVDDQWQKVTHVVRGADLLNNTQRQIHLQHCLGYPTPEYMHIPLAGYADGQKLSKHTHAPAIKSDTRAVLENLCAALRFLGQTPPPAGEFDRPDACWTWAIANWNSSLIPRARLIPYQA